MHGLDPRVLANRKYVLSRKTMFSSGYTTAAIFQSNYRCTQNIYTHPVQIAMQSTYVIY